MKFVEGTSNSANNKLNDHLTLSDRKNDRLPEQFDNAALYAVTDILFVEWPSAETYATLDVRESTQKVVEVMNNYDVKSLLIDASKASIAFNDEDFRTMLAELVVQLGKTHIQKLVRVITSDPAREEKASTLRQAVSFPFDNLDFRTKGKALAWLTTPET